MTWTIDRLRVPATLDARDAHDFREFWRVGNESWRRNTGTDVNDDEAADVLERWRDETYRTHAGLVVRAGGSVAAVGSLEVEKTVERTAEIDVSVAVGHERTGVDDVLLAEIEDLAREHGRLVLQTWTGHRPVAGAEQLVPPTGAGAIPANDPSTERMLRSGYELRQVERNSVFDLQGSYDAVDRQLEDALAKAGPDYRIVWWSGPVPDEYADGYARAVSRMSTDVPAGDMVTEQRQWDAARLRERDARLARAGALLGVTLVVHEPTGEVAAFNDLKIGADRTRPTAQFGTLMMPEHRGRRLGAIVKCVGLRNWHEAVPESPCVSTFNAEENRYMLDVNEAVGFRPVSYAAAWEKTLS